MDGFGQQDPSGCSWGMWAAKTSSRGGSSPCWVPLLLAVLSRGHCSFPSRAGLGLFWLWATQVSTIPSLPQLCPGTRSCVPHGTGPGRVQEDPVPMQPPL